MAFDDFISDCELIDLPMSGAQFTWSRGYSQSRLDRFLVCPRWLDSLLELYQKALDHTVSDHCPILLDPKLESWGPTPFRFDISWLQCPKMEKRLGGWWVSAKVDGPADVVIGSKLRLLKERLKVWSRDRNNEGHNRKRWLLSRIKEIRVAVEAGLASKEEVGSLKEEYNSMLLQEEISWRQKSRVKWISEGDKNTKYFHGIASAWRRRNRIECLRVNDSLSYNKEEISKEITSFFQRLFIG
ncbi:uncharacterized protein LOC143891111 [Tasmannia lanceolata]|uniref:uncharacterized protein LOC143891111 n=1 Tax=Tasmannia lanceolata TaxID=3420 RepID=UPI004062DC93